MVQNDGQWAFFYYESQTGINLLVLSREGGNELGDALRGNHREWFVRGHSLTCKTRDPRKRRFNEIHGVGSVSSQSRTMGISRRDNVGKLTIRCAYPL